MLGVADRGRGPAALTGTALDPADIRRRIYELSRPPLVVEVTRYPAHPSVLLIHVPQSAEIHSDPQGRALRRINRDCLPMDPGQQARLREERRGFDWSAQPAGMDPSAVVPEALKTARAMLSALPDLRRNLAQRSAAEAEAVLRRLASDAAGLLERTSHSRQRRAGTYRLRGEPLRRLGTAVAYHRPSTDETDRKIISHVRDYGHINNRTLQNFLDVGVYKARDIISNLVQRGILARVSAQQRGPNVEWGKGPDFPATRSRRNRQDNPDQ